MFRGTWGNSNWLRNTKARLRAIIQRFIKTETGLIETTETGAKIEFEEQQQ